MTAPEPRIDRRAHRRRDPAVLATILISQLMAHRCSTVYAPTATKLDAFIRDAVLPRLRDRLDVRTVIVEKWDKRRGPTVDQLVDQLHQQLELDADPSAPQKPLAALESLLRRAERRSDRPLLLVLYGLEQLLDDKRDSAEVSRFVEALARMAALPMHGLHLVLGVQEQDLGAFRELLRGRWRLLANDIRIRPVGKAWMLSLPFVFFAYASTKTVTVAAIATACVGTGTVAGAVAVAQICETCPEPPTCEPPPPPKPTKRTPRPVAKPPPAPPPPPSPDESSTGPELDDTTGEPPPPEPEPAVSLPPPRPQSMCSPRASDGICAQCVRSQCCDDLKSCKSNKWRRCVLSGSTGTDACSPELIEKDCRGLALCGLEYSCRGECFDQ